MSDLLKEGDVVALLQDLPLMVKRWQFLAEGYASWSRRWKALAKKLRTRLEALKTERLELMRERDDFALTVAGFEGTPDMQTALVQARKRIEELQALKLERVTEARDQAGIGWATAKEELARVEKALAGFQRQSSEWSDAVTTQIIAHAETKAALTAARAETAQLRERVRAAIDYANGRWSEWGERAETVRDKLELALTSDPEPT
jgi:hypothetical protein